MFDQLSEEQEIFASSLDKWLRSTAVSVTERDGSRVLTQRAFAEMGLLGLTLPEAHGGLGASTVELAIFGRLLGQYLVTDPYLPTAILASGLIELCGSREQKLEWLPELIAGSRAWSVALYERGQGYEYKSPRSFVTIVDGKPALTGKKCALDGDVTGQMLIVSAVDADKELGLFVVDASASEVDITTTLDGTSMSAVRFDQVPVIGRLGASSAVLGAIDAVIDQCLVFTSAQAVGVMSYMYEATLEYIQNRRQFSQRLSDFQVLRHRVVEMKVELDLARAMVANAAREYGGDSFRLYAAAAKTTTGRGGRFVGHQALQLHGGMGMTHEMAVGRYLKRLIALNASFGNADFHEQRFEQLEHGCP